MGSQIRSACLVCVMTVMLLPAWTLSGSIPSARAAVMSRASVPWPSTGTIDVLAPRSAIGPVDTLVTVEVRQYASDSPTYTLSATSIPPDQDGCAAAKPLSSATPFQLDPQRPSDVQFHWPVALGHGQYWFCANPVSGSRPTAMSLASQSFTVLTNAVPTVRITSPTDNFQAGASVTITVSDWLTSDSVPPYELRLLQQGSSAQSETAIVAQVNQGKSNAAAGTYLMTATLPTYLAAGSYAFRAQGECGPNPVGTGNVCAVSEQSAFVMIAAAPTPTVTPQGATTGHSEGNPTGPTGVKVLWLVAAAAAVLVLALLGLGIALARRSRGGNGPRRHTTHQVDSPGVSQGQRAGRQVYPQEHRTRRGP